MKINKRIWAFSTLALFLAVTPAFAASRARKSSSPGQETSTASFGIQYHKALPNFEEYPYDDGDLSYGLAYEIHEALAYWQFAVSYAPSLSRTNNIDYAITPELNLIAKDAAWHLDGGVGILNAYAPSNDENGDDWLGFYYHLMLGFNIPLGKLDIRLYSYYTFDDWGKLSEFDVGDLEFGGWLGYSF